MWHDQVRARGGNSWVAPVLVGEARCSEAREVSVTVRVFFVCYNQCRCHYHRNFQLRVEALVIYYIVPHTLLPGVQVSCSFCATSLRGVMPGIRLRSQSECIAAVPLSCSVYQRRGVASFFA
jgi:hypothetical protein